MVRLLARVKSISIETADMLVHEALSRNLRDRRAVARYAGLTGHRRHNEKNVTLKRRSRISRNCVRRTRGLDPAA